MGKILVIKGADFSLNGIGTQERCESPIISLNRNNALSALVGITTDTDGASIYYTIDGSEPTTSSTLYTGSFTSTHGATIKAIAVKVDYINSTIATSSITYASEHLLYKVSQSTTGGTITVNPESGTRAGSLDYFSRNKSIQVQFTDNAFVYAYDVNGVFLGILGTSITSSALFTANTPKMIDALINTNSWYLNKDNTTNVKENATQVRIVFENVANVGQTIYSY